MRSCSFKKAGILVAFCVASAAMATEQTEVSIKA